MKSKFFLILMSILGIVSLFSVGFATWVLSKPMDNVEYQNAFNTITYELYDNAEYIQITSNTKLEYYNTGFIDDELNIVSTGSMSVTYRFNVQKYKEYLISEGLSQQEINNEGAIIDILFRHNSKSTDQLDFFDGSTFEHSYTIDIDDNLATISEDLTLDHSSLSISFDELPSDEYVEFTITYIFEYNGELGDDFKEEVFSYITSVKFVVEARVTRR